MNKCRINKLQSSPSELNNIKKQIISSPSELNNIEKQVISSPGELDK